MQRLIFLLPLVAGFQASRREAATQLVAAVRDTPDPAVTGNDDIAFFQESIKLLEGQNVSSEMYRLLQGPIVESMAVQKQLSQFLQTIEDRGSNLTQESLHSELKAAGANFAQSLQTLAVRSMHAKGNSGPPSAFPWRHVVQSQRVPESMEDQARLPRFRLGSRGSLASIPLCCFIISVFFAISRTTGDSSIGMQIWSALTRSVSHRFGWGEQGRKAMISSRFNFVPGSKDEFEMSIATELRRPKVFDRRKGMNVWDATVATFSSLVSTGLLAMPYAFSLAGMIAVPLVLFFVACSAYTAHLMVWSLEGLGHSETAGWGSLVGAAFGPRAKLAINIFLVIELWGYLLSSTVCAAMNISQLWDTVTPPFAIGLAVCCAYWLSFVPSTTMTRISITSNMGFVLCCIMFLITGLCLPKEAPSADIQFFRPNGLLLAAGILVYSPAGHSFYPALMQKMEEPEKFPICIRRAYLAACILYLAIAVPGYCLFGNMTQPSAVSNIGVDLTLVQIPGLGWMNSFAALTMAVKMIPSQSLTLVPLTSALEDLAAEPLKGWMVKSLAAPVCLFLSATAAMAYANEMAVLINLIGSVFCMNVSFVMPVACYWKLSSKPVSIMRQALFIGLLAMGSTFAVLGVAVSL